MDSPDSSGQDDVVKRTEKGFTRSGNCIVPGTALLLAFLIAFFGFPDAVTDFTVFLILPLYVPLLVLFRILFLRRRRARYGRPASSFDLESIMLRAREHVGADTRPEFWLSDDDGILFVSEANIVFSAFLLSQKAIRRIVENPEAAEVIIADELILMQSRVGLRSLFGGSGHLLGMIAGVTAFSFLLDGAQFPTALPAQVLFFTSVVFLICVAAVYIKGGPPKTVSPDYEMSLTEAEHRVFGTARFSFLFGPGLGPGQGPRAREIQTELFLLRSRFRDIGGSYWGAELLEPDDTCRALEEMLRAVPDYAIVHVIKRRSGTDSNATELVVQDSDSGRLSAIPHTATECLKSETDLLAYAVYSIEMSRTALMQDRGYWRYMAASWLAAVILSVAVALFLKLDFIVTVLVAVAAIAVATILSFTPIMSRQRRAFSRVELDVQARYPRLIHALEELVKYEKQQSGYSIHESVLLNLRASGRQSLQSSADH